MRFGALLGAVLISAVYVAASDADPVEPGVRVTITEEGSAAASCAQVRSVSGDYAVVSKEDGESVVISAHKLTPGCHTGL